MSMLEPSTSASPEPVWEIATMYPPQGAWSEADYLCFTDDTDHPIEFTKGQLEFLAMPSRAHQRLVKFFLMVLTTFVDKRALGEVLPGGIRVKTEDGAFRIPEVLYLSDAKKAEWGGDRYFTGVDLAIEIVSDDPKSQKRDYTLKVEDYARGRIPEYWIVDPQESKITVLTLPENSGKYTEHGVFQMGDTATSKLLAGFEVAVQAVFDAAKG